MTDTFFYWTGANGTDWHASNPSNWQTPGVPFTQQRSPGAGSDDVAVIQNGGAITVSGGGGAGRLSISNGTAVTVSSGEYSFGGVDDGVLGALVIDGDGSLDVPSGATVADGYILKDVDIVGLASAGALTVESGGGYDSNGLVVGDNAGASGTVTADGATAFEIAQSRPGSFDGELVVGEYGDGSVEIAGGTLFFTATAILGQYQGSNANLTVDGSTWGGGSLYVGEAGTAVATIESGSTVTIGTIVIGAEGKLVVTGGAAGAESTVLAPNLTLAFGTLDVSGFGQVNVGGSGVDGAVSIGGSTLAGLGTINGDVVVQSGGVLEAVQPLAGTLMVNGNISGVGMIQPVMTLEANGAIGEGVTIEFKPPVGVAVGDLVLDVPTAEKGTIVDFSEGNKIDVRGYQYTTAVFTQGAAGQAGTLTLSGGTSAPLQLKVQGDYASNAFTATPGFSDTTIPNTIVTLQPSQSPAPPDDFNNDGKSDLLLENADGQVAIGEVGGGALNYTSVSGLGSEWSFEGNGNFLGQGANDFLIENTTGGVYVGAVSSGATTYTPVTALGSEWKFREAGDFLGNGQDQFLIENTSGGVYLGNVVNGQAQYTPVTALGPEWSFVGEGDLLGDGKTGFLIENTSGGVYFGEMSNGSINYTPLCALGQEWTFKGVGDFLGNGHDQFLLENTSGGVYVGDFVGGQEQFTGISALGPEWKFIGSGDFLGQGKTGFMIENTSGGIYMGLASGASTSYSPVGAIGPEWTSHT
jgi:T5SS/PEP-CTERM-associated repeat protein